MAKLIIVFCVFISSLTSLATTQKNHMIYGETGRLESFDPYTAHEAAGHRLADLIFDNLVDIGPGDSYLPSLAESWNISDDRMAVTFQLRKDVFWHMGQSNQSRKFTANDIVTTVRLLTAPGSEIPNPERFEILASTEMINEHQIKIHLKRSHIDPLRFMTFKILPSSFLGTAPSLKRNSQFAKNPVGTGPYRFVESNPQGEVLLAANERYFGGKPSIEKVVKKSFTDHRIMSQALMYDALDLVTYVSPRDVGEVVSDQNLSILPYDALSFSFVALNTNRGLLKEKIFRQAISFAINRQEMLDAFFAGKGKVISGPFPPTSWAYNLDVKGFPYDPQKAKGLLSSLNLKDTDGDGLLDDKSGKPIALQFVVPLAGENEVIKRIVLAYQSYLAKVGIKIDLQFMDWQVWKDKVIGSHDYDLTLASWSFDDSSNIQSLFHSRSAKPWGNNFVLFRHPEVDSLLTEAQITNDFDKRRAIYQRLHAILSEEAPYTYLWTLQHHAAHQTRLKGVRIEPFVFFKNIKSWAMER
jgi:peptide/nickel transport system substrate-binding protein